MNEAQDKTKTTKTSSTDEKGSDKTTGDSQVQDGKGVVQHEEKTYEKSDEQQEYVDQANNNTKVANESPKSNTM